MAMSSFRRAETCPKAGKQSTTGGVKADPQMATRNTIKNSPTFQPFDEIKFVKQVCMLVKSNFSRFFKAIFV